MSNKLYNILVPVDFTSKNKWAIAKGLEMANQMNCNLHLVNIISPSLFSSFSPYESHVDRLNSYDRLKDLSGSYSDQLCGHAKIEISVLEGNATNKLVDYVREFDMDMVVMGLSKFNLLERWTTSVSINKLAGKTNVPVLAVGSKGLVHHFKKIILPLYDELSLHRIRFATTLARSFRSTIYMVTLRNGNNTPEKIINEGLDIVHSASKTPARGIILEGNNLAKTTIDFAKRINGDLIMINPAEEYKMPGWWNKLTNKLLSYDSGIPVMTMSKQ
ncbi:MAG TPA: universal stress protein [Chitinophagaceae bacterium]|nr:universal stress protein [Chitinophagaceae bacterium]